MAKYSLEQIQSLSGALLDRYYDAAVNTHYDEEIFPLIDSEQIVKLKDLVLDVYFSKLDVREFPGKVKEFITEEDVSSQVISRVLGYDLLPLSDHFGGGIMDLIVENGGDPLLYRTNVAVTEVAQQIRKKAKDVEMPNDRLEKRLLNILRSFASNARTADQVKDMLMGNAKTSGVGLDEGQTTLVMMYAKEEIEKIKQRNVEIISDEQFAEQGSTPPPPPVVEKEEPEAGEEEEKVEEEKPKPKKPQLDAFNAQDQKEIDALKKGSDSDKVSQSAKAIEFTLEGLSDAALDSSGAEFDEDMHKRFRYMVDLYYRDLRDDLETKSKLTMPTQSGGMGLTDEQAASVMSLLKKRIGEYRKFMDTKASAEKERFVNKQNEREREGTEREERQRKHKLDKRFKELTGKEGGTPEVSEQTEEADAQESTEKESGPKVIEVVSHDEEGGELGAEGNAGAEEATSGDVDTEQPEQPDTGGEDEGMKTGEPPVDLPEVPDAQVDEAASEDISSEPAEQEIADQTPEETAVPVEGQVPASPVEAAPPTPQISPPAQVAPPQTKPVVSDVKFTPHLTGPVEELRALTLVDFRRLSKDPKEATLKIMDKIELLQNTSFEMKTDGVKAWQESPANTAYLDVLKLSLEGRPVVDVLGDMANEDPDALTKIEFEALMDLNRTIRFG